MSYNIRIAGIALEIVRTEAAPQSLVLQNVVQVLREGNAVPTVRQIVVEVLREKGQTPSTGGAVVFVVTS